MDPVKERGVVVKCIREGLKQIGGSHHICNASEGISLESDGSVGADGIGTSCKTTIGHIVLHDLNHVTGCLGNTCNFIKSDTIPVAHKSDSVRSHVIEHIGNRCGTAAHQNGIRRKLAVHMGLARAAGTKLDQVIVLLDEGNKTKQIMQLFLLG